ncbi:MAG: hypothetical protein DRP64_11780 [Verrucomicrobia bacterium]|nr:MAG: hypothetical protein DRP64_11780 [Verrucomicrobiota bacterium]
MFTNKYQLSVKYPAKIKIHGFPLIDYDQPALGKAVIQLQARNRSLPGYTGRFSLYFPATCPRHLQGDRGF